MVALTGRQLQEIAAFILFRTFHMRVFEGAGLTNTFPCRNVKVIIVTGTAGLSTGQWGRSCLLNMIEAATGLQEF